MAISVKSKFAGFLRGLIGRENDREAKQPVAAAVPLPPSTAPAPAPAAFASAASAPARSANAEEIELPVAAVIAVLPLDLRAKVVASPPTGLTIRLSAEKVISQLAFGTVRIGFGELRQLAPGVFVNSGGEFDNKLVSLPLSEILPRVNPALLARRSAKKVEVAAEISGPFAERGKGFTFTTQPLKGTPISAPAPKPEPVKPPAPPPPALTSVAAPRQVAPPIAPQIPPRSITPAALPGSNGHGHGNGKASSLGHPLPASSIAPRSTTPATSGTNGLGKGNGHTNGLGNGNGNGNGKNVHGLPPPIGMRLAASGGDEGGPLPTPARTPVTPAPTALRMEPAPPIISAALKELCEHWPAELKEEILSSPLAQTTVSLDGAEILPGLKCGRVVMSWKQLRLLAQPNSAASPKDNLELELPLKVIAPLFFAAQKNLARPQTKASVSAEIPDLFFGFPQPAAAPAAPVVPLVPPLPKPPETKPQDTNFYVWGEKGEAPPADEAPGRRGELTQTDFMSRQAHPKEVIARAAPLPGVAGAVVAMQDGLRVASQVPAELNADTLAAFLPQIFDKLNQSTRELRMGALNNVNFTVGNVPWKIFQVSALYFAAFGRVGEPLPSAQLAQLAAELDRKKQK